MDVLTFWKRNKVLKGTPILDNPEKSFLWMMAMSGWWRTFSIPYWPIRGNSHNTYTLKGYGGVTRMCTMAHLNECFTLEMSFFMHQRKLAWILSFLCVRTKWIDPKDQSDYPQSKKKDISAHHINTACKLPGLSNQVEWK